MHRTNRSIVAAITDRIGGYERLTCPHCTLTIRHRGVSAKEAETYRARMAEHISSHGKS